MTDQNKSVLEGIRELTSHIIARAAEIEAARRIPLDIVQSLKSAGVFRMFVPRSHGGLELALPPEFDKRSVRIIALSVDPVESHSNWANDIEETQGLAPNY